MTKVEGTHKVIASLFVGQSCAIRSWRCLTDFAQIFSARRIQSCNDSRPDPELTCTGCGVLIVELTHSLA